MRKTLPAKIRSYESSSLGSYLSSADQEELIHEAISRIRDTLLDLSAKELFEKLAQPSLKASLPAEPEFLDSILWNLATAILEENMTEMRKKR